MFVVLEGPNGVGKTTVIQELRKSRALQHAFPLGVFSVRLPGHSPGLSELMRTLLVEQTERWAPKDEVIRRLLYAVDARDFMLRWKSELSNPKMLVLCDRYDLSTRAYAAYQGFDDNEFLDALFRSCVGRIPDLQLVLSTSSLVRYFRLAAREAKVQKNKDVTFTKEEVARLGSCYDEALFAQSDELKEVTQFVDAGRDLTYVVEQAERCILTLVQGA